MKANAIWMILAVASGVVVFTSMTSLIVRGQKSSGGSALSALRGS